MRLIPSFFAAVLVALGLWMMAAPYVIPEKETQPAAAPATETLRHHRPNTSPQVVGFALMAGGVMLFLLIMRRRA